MMVGGTPPDRQAPVDQGSMCGGVVGLGGYINLQGATSLCYERRTIYGRGLPLAT